MRLSDEEMMKLVGRIDRIDTCEKDEGVYVKIVDYKSSDKSIDLAAIYEGRQLQLVVYLNAAMENEESFGKKAIPAGVFYYHIDDPMIDGSGDESDEDISKEIMKKLKLTGLVNKDDDGRAIELIDRNLDDGSTVLSVSRTKNGIRASKQVITGDDFNIISCYAKEKIAQIGRSILAGDISVPKADGVERLTEPNCQYCEYRAVCGNGGYIVEALEDGETVLADNIGDNEAIIEMMKGKLS